MKLRYTSMCMCTCCKYASFATPKIRTFSCFLPEI